jgi:hypothetical protein
MVDGKAEIGKSGYQVVVIRRSGNQVIYDFRWLRHKLSIFLRLLCFFAAFVINDFRLIIPLCLCAFVAL